MHCKKKFWKSFLKKLLFPIPVWVLFHDCGKNNLKKNIFCQKSFRCMRQNAKSKEIPLTLRDDARLILNFKEAFYLLQILTPEINIEICCFEKKVTYFIAEFTN